MARRPKIVSNDELINDFCRRQASLGVGESRIIKIKSNFKTILTKIMPEFNLSTAKEQDLILLGEKIRASRYSQRTKEDYFVIIRRYYRVMEGRNARYPEKLDYFKIKRVRASSKTPDDVLSREELNALLEKCINDRDKAIIILLYESGLRCGELLSLNISDVKVVDDGIDIHVPAKGRDGNACKTGSRDIWLTECYGYIKAYLQGHPHKSIKSKPFFIKLESHQRIGEKHHRLDKNSLRSMLHKKADLAGIERKRIHPHAFRHTCATEKAIIGFSESQLNAFMGWRQGSQMAAVYIHMSKRGVKEAYKKALGLPSSEHKAYKACYRCGFENPYTVNECSRCGTSLNIKKRYEDVALQTLIKSFTPEKLEKLNKILEKQ